MIYPISSGHSEIEIEKSRFISDLLFLPNLAFVKEQIKKLKKEHPQARHIVWAFIYGEKGEISGKSDDGEPAGTAGNPTLTILKRGNCSGAMITTIRYFGGIKLGTGGLVRAYTQSAQKAFEAARFQKLQELSKLTIQIPYPLYERFQQKMDSLSVSDHNTSEAFIKTEELFLEKIHLTFEFPAKKVFELESFLKEFGNGKIEYEIKKIPSIFETP